MMIYIFHIFIWEVLDRVYCAIGISNNNLAQYLLPLFVVFISILMALAFNGIVSKYKKHLTSVS